MPAIDLARLRKQAIQLADHFFVPEEFMRQLREMLDFYVNYTLRTKENVAPGSNLKTYRTPTAVLRQIENELRPLAETNPQTALELADLMWEEGALETRLLAAFLLGCIPPQDASLLERIELWIHEVRDPDVRNALLSTSLARMRHEIPEQFFELVRKFFDPAHMRSWSNGILALLPMITETSNISLPTIFDIVEPVIEEAPSTLQNELADLISTLYRASANETTYLLKHILSQSTNPLTPINIRRASAEFPARLERELRDLLRQQNLGMTSRAQEIQLEKEAAQLPPPETPVKEPQMRKKAMDHSRMIYLHGLESTSQSGKARQFAEKFPGMITPDFTGSFEERMIQLKPILGRKRNWIIIGSSFGGLMATVFTCQHPRQVKQLVLLAPALLTKEFGQYLELERVSVPTVLIHGTEDDVVPPQPVRQVAETLFSNLQYIAVEDGHRLQKAFGEINWEEIFTQ